eukprot:TRINITY_DN9826_c0_g1_i1.p1 TRINITY_DN9826_c0_g1~~TRINITY_DN9826_c0_g1_i1.p1  ORF type:complete len:336 (+),score=134.06 TRINITY_DN9826_c0_g1_i1:43-1008(+)
MPVAMETYEDEHRIFLQGLMCKGVLNSKEVNALHEKALAVCKIDIPEKKVDRQKLLVKNIQTINDQLHPVGLIVRKGVDEDTGESCFMLVNTEPRMVGASRELGASVQSQWSAQELEYLRLLATDILQSDKKTITGREALHLTDKVGQNGGKKLSMEEAEGTINRLISARWIKSIEDNREIALDVRFLGEMEGWMVEVVGGVAKCQSCRKVVIRGEYCGCEEGMAWHKYCLDKQAKVGVTTKCKKCGDIIHGPEGGSKRAAEEERGEPRKGARRGSDEEDMDEEDEQPSQNGRARKRSGMEEATPKGRRGRNRRKSGDESD